MNYQETLDYLFNALPMFQRIGAAAFKKDLSNTIKLCEHLGNPQNKFKSIHVAGTNGKGSSSHAIAAVLQESGYKVGLYTSPHLKSFTERIKINGKEISTDKVVEFVAEHKGYLDELKPSFFEMTVGLAFKHFADEKVDYAVVEVGMGGRLDSTNVLQPELCLITNIGLDHTQFLGNTLEQIAVEKAGIIKSKIPVVISQSQEETKPVFSEIANERSSPIYFADENYFVSFKGLINDGLLSEYQVFNNNRKSFVSIDLLGRYQSKNLAGVLMCIELLRDQGLAIGDKHIQKGLAHASKITGLKGRFQKLQEAPLVYCDTGHNVDGIGMIVSQILEMDFRKLHMILGMVNDKDITKVLELLPKDADYTFCQANIPRALEAEQLKEQAERQGLKGAVIKDVNKALAEAIKKADKKDLIFVGGSTFVVAEIDNL
ncbi:bifunctional folylpolyglutamate synthase/dihydrofolate synthase [Echinicola marina]|uniref:bifunctional folylpolyglutamate synthase/dihydrofolate synthase n=1 Tax=Echinicola marina TaxID=2859768 RepID=UPI001CF68832|nr:folylpolyglutamate synthase/dihydrofolate synthase family protein [Echinicola marina]UCS92639.1 bifunctional folylpolyglutamate synthase/dihydrofolate synthase [Echinicola marina]